jgi:hypothetical protein
MFVNSEFGRTWPGLGIVINGWNAPIRDIRSNGHDARKQTNVIAALHKAAGVGRA